MIFTCFLQADQPIHTLHLVVKGEAKASPTREPTAHSQQAPQSAPRHSQSQPEATSSSGQSSTSQSRGHSFQPQTTQQQNGSQAQQPFVQVALHTILGLQLSLRLDNPWCRLARNAFV